LTLVLENYKRDHEAEISALKGLLTNAKQELEKKTKEYEEEMSQMEKELKEEQQKNLLKIQKAPSVLL